MVPALENEYMTINSAYLILIFFISFVRFMKKGKDLVIKEFFHLFHRFWVMKKGYKFGISMVKYFLIK